MKKDEETALAVGLFDRITDAVWDMDFIATKRLYHCTAHVSIYGNGKVQYMVLTSYNTVISVYDAETCTVSQCLRAVYGYTATSAKHDSKFLGWLRENGYPVTTIWRAY